MLGTTPRALPPLHKDLRRLTVLTEELVRGFTRYHKSHMVVNSCGLCASVPTNGQLSGAFWACEIVAITTKIA